MATWLTRLVRSACCSEDSKHVGWMHRQKPNNNSLNLTDTFCASLNHAGKGKLISPLQASQYHVVFVGGLWSHFFKYTYKGLLDSLIRCGMTGERITSLNTSKPVVDNGRFLAEQLSLICEKCEKKLVLLGHSKGALDLMAALYAKPEIRNRVHCLISLQSPFGGSIFADYIYHHIACRASQSIRPVFERHLSGVECLRYESRINWFSDHPLGDFVPVLCLASKCARDKKGSISEQISAQIFEECGLESDGMVILEDAILPHCPYVFVDDMSHLSFVFGFRLPPRLKPSLVTEAVVYTGIARVSGHQ